MRILFLLAIFVSGSCLAQLPNKSVNKYKGSFFIVVNDAATLFLNGKEIFACGIGNHQSPEVEIQDGDRIVARIRDDGGGCDFTLVFVPDDGKTVGSFKAADFRCAPDKGVTDFTPKEFAEWNKRARRIDMPRPVFSVKNYSQPVWGYMSESVLGCIVEPRLFSQIPR